MKKVDHIKHIAENVIKTFDKVSSLIKSQTSENKSIDATNIASMNTFTSARALENIKDINIFNNSQIKKFSEEPAVARILCEDENGKQKLYYISRATPISGLNDEKTKFASYGSPVGALAARNVGSEFLLPNGEYLEVIEKSMLKPSRNLDGWDSINTFISSNKFKDITVKSLKVFLKNNENNQDFEIEDKLSKILAVENDTSNIYEGKKRDIIERMGLRDQPILDEYQDEIFRMPINKKLIILGPPGTGKTTTLIKRLGQKLNNQNLDESEKNIIRNASIYNDEMHFDSWMMFTPTTLLKQYLKEAFSRENVPASDLRIKTWDDHRRELARSIFSILKTANGGLFILNNSNIITSHAISNPLTWFKEFHNWQKNNFFLNLKKSILILNQDEDSSINSIVQNLVKILENIEDVNIVEVFGEIAAKQDKLREIDNDLKSSINKIINLFFNTQLNNDDDFLNKIANFLDTFVELAEDEDNEIDDEEMEEELENEQLIIPSHQRLTNAKNTLERVIKAEARAVVSKRTLSKKLKKF